MEDDKKYSVAKLGGGLIVFLLICLVLFRIFFLHAVKPGPGQEAVLIAKPMLFGHGGVKDTPITTGLSYEYRTTGAIMVNMQPQQVDIEFEDLMTSDGVPIDFHAIVRLQVTDSVKLIKYFGNNWYKNNLEAEVRNMMRQAVRKHGMNETAIDTSAIAAIDAEMMVNLQKYITSAKLPIRLIQVSAGRANPPDAIKTQRIETAAQEQRIKTEQQKKLAEDARLQAEQSRAHADNAYRAEMGLSPEQYVQLQAIAAQERMCGEKNCTFFLPGLGGTPIVSVH